MNYQNAQLPDNAAYVASSPVMTEKTVLKPILAKHMAPQGKCGQLLVESGSLQFVWEDTQETFDADSTHPIIIFPERYHHVVITGPVKFQIKFYSVAQNFDHAKDAIRPGEQFIEKVN